MNIIFQNQDFAVVEKPAGMAVHGGIGIKGKTLVDYLLERFPEIKNVGDALPRTIERSRISSGDRDLRPGIVHRLDRETSGLMLVARNQKTFSYLKSLFKNRQIEKKYLTIVFGKLKNKSGKIEGEMGRSKRDFRKQALARGKVGVRKERYSLSYYNVLKESDGYSLLEVFPKTGRMHQIRVHLHSIGHPVAGDKKYCFKAQRKTEFPRMLLHAAEISFTDSDGREMKFISPIPPEFLKILDKKFQS